MIAIGAMERFKRVLHLVVLIMRALTGWPFPLYHWLRDREMIPNLPSFNLQADIWKFGTLPSSGAPAYTLVPNQLYVATTEAHDVWPNNQGQFVPPIFVRIPLAQLAAWQGAAIIETPRQTQRFYLVRWKQRMHEGFPNEYLAALVEQCDQFGAPIFRDVAGYVQGANFLLAENDDVLISETGDQLITE